MALADQGAATATASAALVAEDIHNSFGDLEVLKGVSLTAREGDVIAMLGSSGSGKSTFLRCLNLLERPNAGRIVVAGESLRLKPAKHGGGLEAEDREQIRRIRARLSMVFQSFNLWSHMTVMQNVVEAPIHVLKRPKAEAVDYAGEILKKVGLYDRRDYYPLHLSGGQQQRVAIARALAMKPEVLLPAEPSSALEPELVGEVLRVIRRLADEGRTMIVVTHEMGFAREVSSETVFLHEGRVEEQGPPKEVFSNPRSTRFRQFLEGTLK